MIISRLLLLELREQTTINVVDTREEDSLDRPTKKRHYHHSMVVVEDSTDIERILLVLHIEPMILDLDMVDFDKEDTVLVEQ